MRRVGCHAFDGSACARGSVGVVLYRICVGNPSRIQTDNRPFRRRQVADNLVVVIDLLPRRRSRPTVERPARQTESVGPQRFGAVVNMLGVCHTSRNGSACADRLVGIVTDGICDPDSACRNLDIARNILTRNDKFAGIGIERVLSQRKQRPAHFDADRGRQVIAGAGRYRGGIIFAVNSGVLSAERQPRHVCRHAFDSVKLQRRGICDRGGNRVGIQSIAALVGCRKTVDCLQINRSVPVQRLAACRLGQNKRIKNFGRSVCFLLNDGIVARILSVVQRNDRRAVLRNIDLFVKLHAIRKSGARNGILGSRASVLARENGTGRFGRRFVNQITLHSADKRSCRTAAVVGNVISDRCRAGRYGMIVNIQPISAAVYLFLNGNIA